MGEGAVKEPGTYTPNPTNLDNFDVFGTVYLPRGASLQFQGSGNIDPPVQFIAGTYGLRGGAQINPHPLTPGFALMKTVLVE
jgi:hypothetical protein